MKKWLGLLILCVWGVVPIMAKVYQVRPELLQEVKANRALAQSQPSAEALFELAMSYAYTGQIEKGWSTLRKIPDYDKNYPPKVVEKYERLSRAAPTEWKYPFKLAFGYYFLDQKDKSIECFRKVLEIDPKNAWALGFIALIKGERGEISDAIEIAKQSIRIEPNAAALHFLLGVGYGKAGNYWGSMQEMVVVGRLKAQEAVAFDGD
jgi:tetratricopeptide (TPR) repeat protein